MEDLIFKDDKIYFINEDNQLELIEDEDNIYYGDIFDIKEYDDEIFKEYGLAFYDVGFEYSDVLEFACDFDLDEMEFYGEVFKAFLHNMNNLTEECKEALEYMGFDDWEEFESDLEYVATTNMFFEQLLKDILKIEDEDKQADTIYQIFNDSIDDADDVRYLLKSLYQ